MAKSPSSTPFNGKGYSAKFTQSYPGWENDFVNRLFSLAEKEHVRQTTAKEQSVTVSNELARLDHLEEEVQNMLTYPEAEAIITKIIKEIKND